MRPSKTGPVFGHDRRLLMVVARNSGTSGGGSMRDRLLYRSPSDSEANGIHAFRLVQ